jgi:hypothetical protein
LVEVFTNYCLGSLAFTTALAALDLLVPVLYLFDANASGSISMTVVVHSLVLVATSSSWLTSAFVVVAGVILA